MSPDPILTVRSVNISEKKGTIKTPVGKIILNSQGVEGDAHAGPWNRQVSLLGTESIERTEKEAGRKIRPGEFAENITTTGMSLWEVHPLDRFTAGELVLEVTQIGKSCHGSTCAIFKEVGNCVMPKEGVFCRVVAPGILKPGDRLAYHPKTYRLRIITLSDRASRGEYEDKSGPRIRELTEEFFSTLHLPSSILSTLIPDDAGLLKDLLVNAIHDQVDILFTTGGTGIGPRDITPEVIKPLLDKEIPGIMEMIRVKFGAEHPSALLSRSLAGIAGKTLLYALPGSVKAINEYLPEIFKTLIHSVLMIHALDMH
ncbi:MAG TPA: molybdenum cofactor synthesis domain-containing protein [Bacteroidales bacterium]|nr:molybdenum cofactor synthesis domain-containing protein [Bacteroidales bacterium]